MEKDLRKKRGDVPDEREDLRHRSLEFGVWAERPVAKHLTDGPDSLERSRLALFNSFLPKLFLYYYYSHTADPPSKRTGP